MKSFKIYVAAPWVDKNLAAAAAEYLQKAGHTITRNWWDFDSTEDGLPESFLRECAKKDVEGVVDCDVVIVMNTQKSEGKAVEQGIAIALEKPIICITYGAKPSSNIFHNLSCYQHVTSLGAAVEALKQYV